MMRALLLSTLISVPGLALADRVQAIVGGRLSEPVPIESLDARRQGGG